MQENPPQLPSVDDKKCQHVYSETGKQCGAYHTLESKFCFKHSELAALYEERRKAAMARQAILMDELTSEYHQLRTNEDFVLFIEKWTNAVSNGACKDSKRINMIVQLISQAGQHIKAAKEKPADMGLPAGLRVTETRSVELTWQSEHEMDSFLQAADPRIQMRILDDMGRGGRIKTQPIRREAIDVSIEPPDQTLETGLISIPVPEISPHDWYQQVVPKGDGTADLYAHCLNCGLRRTAKNRKEACKP